MLFSFSAEQNRTDRVDLVRLRSEIELNRTHGKVPVRLCSITEPNRTSIERLSSIDFWFGFVQMTTPGVIADLFQMYCFCMCMFKDLQDGI